MEHTPEWYQMDRRSGKTTRRIDACIQDFFKTGVAFCQDDYHPDQHTRRELGRRMVKIVCNRLVSEHGIPFAELTIDKSNNIFYIKSQEFSRNAYNKLITEAGRKIFI